MGFKYILSSWLEIIRLTEANFLAIFFLPIGEGYNYYRFNYRLAIKIIDLVF